MPLAQYSEKPSHHSKSLPALVVLLILTGLYVTSLYNYLLFHSLVEISCVVISCVIFVLAWNTRPVQENRYLLFLGIAFLYTAVPELLHMLAFKGLGVFPGHDANMATQLWIVFRYLTGLSFLIAPLYLTRPLRVGRTMAVYTVVTVLAIGSIFMQLFPACYVEGRGLTPFKIISEYVIVVLFLASLALLLRHRLMFDRNILKLMTAVILASVASELSFTQYISVFGSANLIGHLFLFLSFYFLYRAIVVTGIVDPASLLFRNLKLSEEHNSRLNEQLQHTNAQLEAANRELEAFSYSVSHDLRTPLRAIDGFSKAIEEEHASALGDAGRDYFSRVRAAAGKMSQLIDALLELSRKTRGDLNRSSVDLSAIAKNETSELAKTEPGRRVEFRVPDGITAEGDPVMLRVLIGNLIGNAWKFSCKCNPARVEFGVMSSEFGDNKKIPNSQLPPPRSERVYFVRDNGAGFDMDYAGKLFKAFQRLHTAEEFPGLGIGLATAQRIVHRHGGKIWAEGEIGKGATFYFTL